MSYNVPLRSNVQTRMRRSLMRCRSYSACLLAGLRLAAAVLIGRSVQLWVGDSHAVFLAGTWPGSLVSYAGNGRFVWHLGPRLMHSLARSGFPTPVYRTARLLGVLSRRNRIVLIVVAGEIDIRCHLVDRAHNDDFLNFIPVYLDRVKALSNAARASAVVVVPVPPGDKYADAQGFPTRGLLAERIRVFGSVRASLAEGSAKGVAVLDATSMLAADDGSLRPDRTIDGCHVDAAAAALVRAELSAALATTTA